MRGLPAFPAFVLGAAQLPAVGCSGAQGPPGPPGPAGDTGPAGIAGGTGKQAGFYDRGSHPAPLSSQPLSGGSTEGTGR